MKKNISIFLALLLHTAIPGRGQTLRELINQAQDNYPLLKAKKLEVQASREQVAYSKSTAWPSMDAGYQLNYATYNNITGMAVSNTFVPISGPPSTGNEKDAVWGSAAGMMLNWEAFTFGQRNARIEQSRAVQSYQEAEEAREIFHHQVRTAGTYLEWVMTTELFKVFLHNMERAMENLQLVRSLAQNGLRPDVDTALFHMEHTRAKIELLNQEKFIEIQEQKLSELLGGSEINFTFDSSFFQILPVTEWNTPFSEHPLIRLSSSGIRVNEAGSTALRRTLYPRLTFWGTAYARGSGIRYDGYVNSIEGLSFSRYNYGAGMVVSLPLLQYASLRFRLQSQNALIRAENEKLNWVRLQLDTEDRVADLSLENALKIAGESPSFYHMAEFSYRALLSRYLAGLANYADLIQAQYTLVKAETEWKKSYIDAWKALLYKAIVQGDINIFLNQLSD